MADEPARQADRLVRLMAGWGSTLVAFSGGVDSGLVLAAAVRALGTTRVAALTAVSPALPSAELAAARRFTDRLGVRHLTPVTAEWAVPGYRDNGPRRCYFCKSTLMDAAVALAAAEQVQTIATGTNASDVVAGFRPGIAAAAERGARAPLAELGIDKAGVRAVSRHWGLPTADKPAAPCLASRIAYGVPVTPARLARVERAEAGVRRLLGPAVRNLRVRDLGDAVRVEVDADLVEPARTNPELPGLLHLAGFTGDLTVAPFRSGSLNLLLADTTRADRTYG